MTFYKTLLKLALPIMMQNFLSSFINILDTIMVGRLGVVEIGAVGLGNQVFFIMNLVLFGICSGGAVFISQFWGKRDLDGIRHTIGIITSLSIVVSLIFTALALYAPELCLRLYTKDPVLIREGAKYLTSVSPSYIFTAFGFVLSNAEKSTEHVKVPTFATALSLVLNAFFNFILIFGVDLPPIHIPSFGIVGAAAATVISRIVECAILFIVPVVKNFEFVSRPSAYFCRNVSFMTKYARICLPVLINETLWGIGISMQSSIFAHSGTDIIAAYNIRTSIDDLLWIFIAGFASATSIIIGKTIGEGKNIEAREIASRMCKIMLFGGLLVDMLIIPISKVLPVLFNVDVSIINITKNILYLNTIFYPLIALNVCTVVGIFRSGGDTIFASFIDIGFMWLISLPLGFIGVLHFGLPYWVLFIFVHTEDIFKAIAGLIRVYNGKWIHNVTV